MNNLWAIASTTPFYRVTIKGKENLPPSSSPAVYVANHQSFMVRRGRGSGRLALWGAAPEGWRRVWGVARAWVRVGGAAALSAGGRVSVGRFDVGEAGTPAWGRWALVFRAAAGDHRLPPPSLPAVSVANHQSFMVRYRASGIWYLVSGIWYLVSDIWCAEAGAEGASGPCRWGYLASERWRVLQWARVG